MAETDAVLDDPVPVVDGHLDMAGNVVVVGRDYDLTVDELRRREARSDHQVMVSLPELRRGGVAIVLGSLFVGTSTYDGDLPVYDPPAADQARRQLDVYRRWEETGRARIVRDRRGLADHLERWRGDRLPGVVIAMESADPIADPDELTWWWDAGVRSIGPAWRRTRYAGGAGMPGPLTPLGRDLIAAMRDVGVILDVAHLAEEAFWEALDIGVHALVATHANVRALRPGDRQLSDAMITAIAERDGVVGVIPVEPLLTLDAVAEHMHHIAALTSWDHVGIGSDLDGGYGLEETPPELTSVADLRRLGEAVPAEHRSAVLGGNWLRVLASALPD